MPVHSTDHPSIPFNFGGFEMEQERCIECDEVTGNAGKGEGSLYWEDIGPLCSDCFRFDEGDIDETDHTEGLGCGKD